MEKGIYISYLEGTIRKVSKKNKEIIRDIFIKNSLAKIKVKGDQLSLFEDNSVDISNLALDDQLITCLKENEQAIIEYEKWEFFKDYKYSVVFSLKSFEEDIVELSKVDALNNEIEKNYLFEFFNTPVKYEDENLLMIKFGLSYSALHPATGNELLLKYPFLVVLHKNEKFVEFRFDGLGTYFKEDNSVYSNLVQKAKSYLKNHYNLELDSVDLDFIQTYLKDQDDKQVKIIAQSMELASGGNAQLAVGKNQEYVLPFIGELRNLIVDNQDELEKVPIIKEALEQFIFEKEEMSYYPWIEVYWENEIVKTRSIHAKFIFNYMNGDYCLIQHYYNNALAGMERINYVIRYIKKCRDDYQKKRR